MAAQSEVNRWFRRRPRCCVIGHAADASQHRQACGVSVASPQRPIARRSGPEHDQVTAPTRGCARLTHKCRHGHASHQGPGHPARRHFDALKRELVERCLEPGASVAAIALEAGVNANLLFNWNGCTCRPRCRPPRYCGAGIAAGHPVVWQSIADLPRHVVLLPW